MRKMLLLLFILLAVTNSAYSQRMTVITEQGKSYKFVKMVSYTDDGQFQFIDIKNKNITLAQASITEIKFPSKWELYCSGCFGSYFLYGLYDATKIYGYGQATIPIGVGIVGISGLIYYVMPKHRYYINKMTDEEIKTFVTQFL